MTYNVRITALDGKLPNLAVMRLSAYHKSLGHNVYFSKSPERDLSEPAYDRVYGSAIFSLTKPNVDTFRAHFPDAILGGTGTGSTITLEEAAPGIANFTTLDYSIYPDFPWSIGMSMRGCRNNAKRCPFCVVPFKEGRAREETSIADIWRGPGHPKALHLLDNDFFGTPGWQRKLDKINAGGFAVCWSQGINVRLLSSRIAKAIAETRFMSFRFTKRQLYGAWDHRKDADTVLRGLDYLLDAGIKGWKVTMYMLIGFEPAETWADIEWRYRVLADRGVRPYPMPYFPGFDATPAQLAHYRRLKQFQRWALTPARTAAPTFADYNPSIKRSRPLKKPSSLPLLDL